MPQGRFDEAIAHFERLLPLVRKLVGKEHAEAGQIQQSLAVSLRHKGRHVEAKKHFDASRAIIKKHFGGDRLKSVPLFF